MAKFAEKLTILAQAGDGLLDRLSYTKKVFSSPTQVCDAVQLEDLCLNCSCLQRPAFVADAAFQKVVQALLKKYPEFESSVEKVF